MRRFGGSLALGLASATFFLAPVLEQLLRLTPAKTYFLKYSPDRSDYSVLLGLILIIGVLVGLAHGFAHRYQAPFRLLLEAPVMLLLALGIEHVIHLHLSRYPPLWNSVTSLWRRIGVTGTDGWFVTGFICGLAVMFGIWRMPQVWASAKTLVCGGSAALWIGCILCILRPPAPLPLPAPHSQVQPGHEFRSGQPVVWIILDEWDYDLTYKRPDGKIFPEFERLRQQSVFLDHVQAAGKMTLTAIPSLLMGRAVRDYRAASASTARFAAVADVSESFPGPKTIFDFATQLGYRSQIVGWYHPYCRIFGAQVESCWWDSKMLQGAPPGRPLTERAAAFLRESIELEILPVAGPSNTFRKHLERVNPMVEEAALAASRPGRMFSFLHLPVPHGPFFTLESDGSMTPLASNVEGYQSGLDAADRALGKIRAAMERAGNWDEALLVVSSDHPYRYQFEGGYGNGHIPMMIKLPHQSTPSVYSRAFLAFETKGLLEDFMQGRVTSPESALAWLEHDAPAQGGQVKDPVPVSWLSVNPE